MCPLSFWSRVDSLVKVRTLQQQQQQQQQQHCHCFRDTEALVDWFKTSANSNCSSKPMPRLYAVV